MASEGYYISPHCMGKVMIVLKENGRLVLLRRALGRRKMTEDPRYTEDFKGRTRAQWREEHEP